MDKKFMLESLKLYIVDVNDIDALSISSVFDIILSHVGIDNLGILVDDFIQCKVKECDKPTLRECIKLALEKINILKEEIYALDISLTYDNIINKINSELYPKDLIKRFREGVSEAYFTLVQEKIDREKTFKSFRRLTKEDVSNLIEQLDISFFRQEPLFGIDSLVEVIIEFVNYLLNDLMLKRNDAFINGREDEVVKLDGISERLRDKFTLENIETYIKNTFNSVYISNIVDIIDNDYSESKMMSISDADCELFVLTYVRNSKDVEFISLENAYNYLVLSNVYEFNLMKDLKSVVQYLATICRKETGELYSDLEIIEFTCAKLKRKIYADAKDTIEGKMADYVIRQEEAKAVSDIVKKQLN